MSTIIKLKLVNFKKFKNFEILFDDKLNLLIGDNEAGKSSILLGLDLAISASKSKVETFGLEALFNTEAIYTFLAGDKKYINLPKLQIEVYLADQHTPDLNGKNNSDKIICDGIRLIIEPIEELNKEIQEILDQADANFPFEYYSIRFSTFADSPYTGFRRYVKHLLIDSSLINNEYATREYIRTIYNTSTESVERNKYQNEYRRHKSAFKDGILSDVNKGLTDYEFAIKTNSKSNLETDLTITEDNIAIEQKGKGRQCFIKTEFALKKNNRTKELDALFLEEPENHLSHLNMRRLITKIKDSDQKQLFIATHSSLVATRLDLRKAILLNSGFTAPLTLKDIPKDTASFFMKAPDNNILEFILSKKVILVEGDAEYILIEDLFKTIAGLTPEEANVHIISVGGTSFKRYLDLAKILKIQTAVIRDNDKDYTANCVNFYTDYTDKHIKIFSDTDNNRSTFEICFYQDNKAICDEILGERKTLTVQEYMLKNKTDTAFSLLDNCAGKLESPQYIKDAVLWIK